MGSYISTSDVQIVQNKLEMLVLCVASRGVLYIRHNHVHFYAQYSDEVSYIRNARQFGRNNILSQIAVCLRRWLELERYLEARELHRRVYRVSRWFGSYTESSVKSVEAFVCCMCGGGVSRTSPRGDYKGEILQRCYQEPFPYYTWCEWQTVWNDISTDRISVQGVSQTYRFVLYADGDIIRLAQRTCGTKRSHDSSLGSRVWYYDVCHHMKRVECSYFFASV